MLKQTAALLFLAAGMTGCVSYGHSSFAPTQGQAAQMEAESHRVQDTERVERAERRAEHREDMMNEADAINRARGDRNVYIMR